MAEQGARGDRLLAGPARRHCTRFGRLIESLVLDLRHDGKPIEAT
jgi:hypothetical protein